MRSFTVNCFIILCSKQFAYYWLHIWFLVSVSVQFSICEFYIYISGMILVYVFLSHCCCYCCGIFAAISRLSVTRQTIWNNTFYCYWFTITGVEITLLREKSYLGEAMELKALLLLAMVVLLLMWLLLLQLLLL